MPHLSGHCDCGRPIHLPKGASSGHRWTCHRCGKSWKLDLRGNNPVHKHPSRRPDNTKRSSSLSARDFWNLLIALFVMLWLLSTCS